MAPVAGAVIGAISSKQQADAANKKKSSWTDQTTTNSPYFADTINPDIGEVLNYQRGIIQRGAPQVDKHGNVTYAAVPQGSLAAQPQGTPGAKSPGGGDPGQLAPLAAPSKGGGKGKGKGGGKKVATGNPTTTGPAPKSAADIFREVAERGMAAGDSESIKQARVATGNILGAAGGGGPEDTGFEGYNPILDRLAGTLESDVEGRVGKDLLLKFLGGGAGGGASGGGDPFTSPAAAAGRVPYYVQPNEGAVGSKAWYKAQGEGPADPRLPPPSGGANNRNGVPDTMAVDSYFGDETRKIMDEQANEAELGALIKAMNEDTEKGMFRDLAQLDAAAAGSGRFGGDMWKGMSSDAREEALQEMLKTSSGVRMTDREARRQARLAALQGVNQRDLGLLGANVQREGIAASERAAGAGAAAAAQAAADQLALARRGQDLSAIGALMDSEQFSLGQLGDVGAQLSGDRLNTLGLIPGMEGVGLSGLNAALGGGQGLNDITKMQNDFKLGQGQLGVARQGLNQQLGMFNAGQSQNVVDDYLKTLLGIGSMGGTSRTVGQNVVPGAGVSSGGAMLQGALGGALAGYGASRGY